MTLNSERLAAQERVALPTETMTIMMGPVHPAMHGTVRVVVTVDGHSRGRPASTSRLRSG